MKLNEYIHLIQEVTKVDEMAAAIYDSIPADPNDKEEDREQRKKIETFRSTRQDIHQAMKENRTLLGIFDDSTEVTPEEVKRVCAAEINPENLRRHILKIRMDIRKQLEENGQIPETQKTRVMMQALEALSKGLGVNDLGRVFGEDERNAYRDEFPPQIVPQT